MKMNLVDSSCVFFKSFQDVLANQQPVGNCFIHRLFRFFLGTIFVINCLNSCWCFQAKMISKKKKLAHFDWSVLELYRADHIIPSIIPNHPNCFQEYLVLHCYMSFARVQCIMVEIEPNAINEFVNEATLKITSRKVSVRGISEIKIANILRSICAVPGLALRDG